jgi:hypothetical protein
MLDQRTPSSHAPIFSVMRPHLTGQYPGHREVITGEIDTLGMLTQVPAN